MSVDTAAVAASALPASSRYVSTCSRTQLTIASLAIIFITGVLLVFSIQSATPDGENSCGYNPAFALEQEPVQITRSSLPMSDRMSADTADYRLVRMKASAWSFTQANNNADKTPSLIDPTKRMPVLFVHGHRGSYMQSQYVAAKLDELSHQQSPATQPQLDIWAIDFGNRAGGNPAFSASILLEQAWFINDVLVYLQQLYGNNQHIQAFGLSFGGVALRLALTLDNHPIIISNNQTGSIQSCLSVVYTLNSPHRAHPVFIESDMATLYHDLNHAYAEAYSSENTAGSFASRFQHTSFISLSGGFRDRSVRSDLGSLDGIVPESHALHAYTSSVPDVDIEMDHDSIVWCRQMVVKLSVAMVKVAHIERLTSSALQQVLQMEYLRNHFLSTNPVKLQLTTAKRFRVSGVDETQFEPTLRLSNSQLEELSMSSQESLLLTHPFHRNSTALHRDVQIQLASSESSRCSASKGVHTVHPYPVSNKGIYKLEIDSNLHAGANEQIVHSIRIPAAAPFEYLTFFSNIPAEYLCMSLASSDSTSDAAAKRIDVSEWLVSMPENTAQWTTKERLENFQMEQHQRKANVHQWTNRRVMTILMLPHESMPITLRYLHIHFQLPREAAGVALYGLVQFTPPQHLTTKVESSWIDTTVSASHTSFIKLPAEYGVIPQSPKFIFTHFAPATLEGRNTTANGNSFKTNPWLFRPFFYTVAMPSGESAWGLHFQHKEGWLSTHSFHPHISTQPQTTYTIMFVDPTYDFRFIVSHQRAHWYSFGLNFRVHNNYILLSFFTFLLTGLAIQIQTTYAAANKLQTLVKEDKAMQQEQQVMEATSELQTPLYAILTSHIPSCIVISAFYVLIASNFFWMFKIQNIGYIPTMMMLFQYLMIGWSAVVVTHFVLSKLHQLLLLMLRCCCKPSRTLIPQNDDDIPLTLPPPMNPWKKRVGLACIILAVVFYPYPVLTISLFITTVRYVYLGATQPSSAECMQFRSLVFFPVSHVIETILFLLWIIVGTKSVLIYQSSISSPPSLSLYSIFFQLQWIDAGIVALAISFLRKMCWSSSSVSMVATFSEFIPPTYAVKTHHSHADQYAAILNRKAIIRGCILAILAAYTSLYVYYYRMAYFTAMVLVGFLYEDMRQFSTGVWGKLVDYNVGQGRHPPSAVSTTSHHHREGGEDDTPTLDMLGDLNTAHHHGSSGAAATAHWGSAADGSAQEMHSLLHPETNNQILRRSV